MRIDTPTIAKITNLTDNGVVKTSGSDGTLGVDTATYMTTANGYSRHIWTLAVPDDPLSTGTNKCKLVIYSPSVTIYPKVLRISVGTAPTGSGLRVELKAAGTTILTGTAYLEITAGNTTATQSSNLVASIAANSLLTVDIDQIGATIPGCFLTVELEAKHPLTT